MQARAATHTMRRVKAARVHEWGGIENVGVDVDVPKPAIGPHDALVEVRTAALNHLDIWVRMGGLAPNLPHTLGSDAAGVVAELGAEASATGLKVGDEVVIDPGLSCGRCERCRAGEQSECAEFHLIGEHVDGTFAEYVRVPALNCYPRPRTLTWEESAALPLVFLTAWRMLMTRARLRPGEMVLVVGIGSGVSMAALAIARAVGAQAIVTSSSDEKLARATRDLGAVAGLNYRRQDVAKEARRLTGGRGVDVVVDSAGQATFGTSLRALRKGGRLVTCGATSGPKAEADIQRIFWNQLAILGSTMGSPREMREVLRLVESGRIKPAVDSVFPLDEAVRAQQRLESGSQLGKIVLRVRPE